MTNTDFSCFTDASYLKDKNGKYCARYAIAYFIFKATEIAPLTFCLLKPNRLNYTPSHEFVP